MEARDAELENLLGNLLIAEYQVDKLRGRLAEKVVRVVVTAGKTTSQSIRSGTGTNSSGSAFK